jgi:hypothetical protein
MVGPLVAVAVWYERRRSRPMQMWVENIESVQIWKKVYSSSCQLCTMLVKAISMVAAAPGLKLQGKPVYI